MLEQEFLVQTGQHRVTFDDEQLVWTNVEDESSQVTVATSDIITVKLEGATGKRLLIVQYINKQKDYVWASKKEEFSGDQEESVWEAWWQAIRNALQKQDERPKKLLVFINPMSGGKKGVKIYESNAAPLFSQADITTDVVVTKDDKHAEELLDTYDIASLDGFVCVGGDGTIVEVLNAYYKRLAKDENIDLLNPQTQLKVAPLPLGFIPAGSNNGLAASSFGTKDPTTAALHIIKGHRYSSPGLAFYNGPSMLLGCLFAGMGTMADMMKSAETRRHLGSIRFLIGIGESVWTFRSRNMKVLYLKSDGEWEAVEKSVKGITMMLAQVDKEKKELVLDRDTCMLSIMADCSRGSYLNYMRCMFKQSTTMFDSESTDNIFGIKEVKMTWPDDSVVEASEPVILDGNLYYLKSPMLHIKTLPAIFNMYGQHHPIKLP